MNKLVQRDFILGDKWLYYKFYCGKRTADMILINVIKPLLEELFQEELIDKWFFIRYSDPNSHLRIRFSLNDIFKIGIVINKIKNSIAEYINNGLIWKVQTDTYKRELERYGTYTIDDSETLFYYDSEICINSLSLIEEDELLFLFSLRSIDNLLTIFDFDLEQKIHFTKKHFDAFKEEFNADKNLNKQLNKKYQFLRKKIESFILKPHKEYDELIYLISTNNQKLNEIANTLKIILENDKLTIENLLSSHIHMMVNRFFRDQQRLHELICYSSLYRFYKFKNSINE